MATNSERLSEQVICRPFSFRSDERFVLIFTLQLGEREKAIWQLLKLLGHRLLLHADVSISCLSVSWTLELCEIRHKRTRVQNTTSMDGTCSTETTAREVVLTRVCSPFCKRAKAYHACKH